MTTKDSAMATPLKLVGVHVALGLCLAIAIACGLGWLRARSEAARNRYLNDALGAEISELQSLSAAEQQKAAEHLAADESRIKELELGISKMLAAHDAEVQAGRAAWPNGRVRLVDPYGKKVWIDLGEADEVDPRTVFDVYSKPQTNVNQSKPAEAGAVRNKGTVEVTRVLEQKLSEARILKEDPDDPIRRGDPVVLARPAMR
jgi:hypothetical protein